MSQIIADVEVFLFNTFKHSLFLTTEISVIYFLGLLWANESQSRVKFFIFLKIYGTILKLCILGFGSTTNDFTSSLDSVKKLRRTSKITIFSLSLVLCR